MPASALSTRPNRPTERDPDGLPVGFSRECDVDLPRKLYSAWIPDLGPREIVRELTADERAKLEARVAALTDALWPHEEYQIPVVEVELASMFSGYRAMRQTGEDVASVVEVTRRVLREFPQWAISRACLLIARNQAVVDGKRLDRRFAPNDGEIHAVVDGLVKLHREALTRAKALLSAPVEPPSPQRPKASDGKFSEWEERAGPAVFEKPPAAKVGMFQTSPANTKSGS